MTNREWLNSLSNEKMAEKLHEKGKCGLCIWEYKECMDCANGITQWLNKKHIEPMPEIKAGDFIYTKTEEYGSMLLICVKEEKDKILYIIDKETCVSLSAFLYKEIRKICRYDSKKHCIKEIWRADDDEYWLEKAIKEGKVAYC